MERRVKVTFFICDRGEHILCAGQTVAPTGGIVKSGNPGRSIVPVQATLDCECACHRPQ
jgi:hypothetical protein